MGADVASLDGLITELKTVGWKDRDSAKEALFNAASALLASSGASLTEVVEHIESAKAGLSLEIRWELDEVVERLTPAEPEPEPEPEPEEPEAEAGPQDPNQPLSMADLVLAYDDPRGLALHKTKDGQRWFATQVDPATRQPRTFELHPQEIAQLQLQLKGSPYWVLGAGGA